MDTLNDQPPGPGREGRRAALPAWLSHWSRARRRNLRSEVLDAVETLRTRVALCEARAADALASIAAIRGVPDLDSPQLRTDQREVEFRRRRARRIGAAAHAVAAAAGAPVLPTGRELHQLHVEATAYLRRLAPTESELHDRQYLLAHSREVLVRHLGTPATGAAGEDLPDTAVTLSAIAQP